MRQAQVMQWMSAVAMAAAWSGSPALACPDHQGGAAPAAATASGGAHCENGVCKLDDAAQVAHADKKDGDACCKDEAKGAKGDKDCCKEEGKGAKGGECCANDEKAGHHHAQAKADKDDCCKDGQCEMEHGAQGMGGHHMGMRARWHHHMMNAQRIAELRYLPGMNTAGAGPNNFIVLGGGIQGGGDVFSLAWQHNLAVQLNPAGGAGNWVAPYCGIVPRLGVQLGTARVDVGVLGGFGGMVRTLGSVAPGAQVLDARLQWVVEPRIELGMKNDHMGVALVGSYMLTPNMNDMGGVGAGLKFTFKGHGW
jgi:hypothetical protein